MPVWPLAVYLLVTLEPPAFLRAGATITIENLLIGLLFICAGVCNHCLLAGTFHSVGRERGGEGSHVRYL